MKTILDKTAEEFDKKFKCINEGCDNNGSIAVQVEDGWEQQQCQFCYELRLPYKKFIREAQIKAIRDTQDVNYMTNECKHNFKYSHIEYPPIGTCTAVPKDKEVVVCRKCGLIIKTDRV